MGDVQDDMTLKYNTTIYFGYGSNLWRRQMAERCPTSKYLGVGRLDGWKWIINGRGYADVVQVPQKTKDTDYSHSVFGLVYALQPGDEKNLDKNEGVPVAYTKEWHDIQLWEFDSGVSGPDSLSTDLHLDLEARNGDGSDFNEPPVDVTRPPTRTVSMLVYVDRVRTAEGKPKTEYVDRMNFGIRDAVRLGVPGGYVESVMRRFIPNREVGEERREKAFRQARRFVDESGVFERVD
jgi:hypothetical protein